MERINAAVQANIDSLKNVMAGNKEGWLALFADDAVVHDPVGPSSHDPSGEGFRGKDRISEFWDIMIAPGDLNLIPHKRIAVGDHHAAVFMSAANTIGDFKTQIEMIVTYEVDDEGKVKVLKAHWDVEGLNRRMAEQSAA